MKLALYTRVSTDQQNATNQVLELKAWAERQGHTIVAEYQDVASGARRREHLDDLFQESKRHTFGVVAFWSLDRVSREGPMRTLVLLDELTRLGVKFYFHRQPYIDPAMPFYGTMVALLADLAKMERELISERTKAGLARVRQSGKRLGRPPGSKDKSKRKRAGYYARWEGARPVNKGRSNP